MPFAFGTHACLPAFDRPRLRYCRSNSEPCELCPMKVQRKFRIWLVVGPPILLVAATAITVIVQLRQESLNSALYFALNSRDLPATTRLLNRGADPNAGFPIDGPRPSEGFREIIERV